MASTQYAGSAKSSESSSSMPPGAMDARRAAAPANSASGVAARADPTDVHALLGQFDVMINQMGGYPAKDIINSLTMLAERVQFAPQIVSFIETKIHRVAPAFKLPIFYLMDSILKNVSGPYPTLFSRVIVPLYCNCVKQVNGKDLRRFIHVLNTWESTRLFPRDAVHQMRMAANRAQAVAGPAVMNQPASFSKDPTPPSSRSPANNTQDMELRSLLTQLQNDMGIHPTEHMSLEEVRANNPAYYQQLLEFQAQSKAPPAPAPTPAPVASAPSAVLGVPPPTAARIQPPPPRRDPRRTSSRPGSAGSSQYRREPENRAPSPGPQPGPKSANVAHLMHLLKRKKMSPPPEEPMVQNEITNDPPRAPDAAAVMSILQKLKGIQGNPGGAPVLHQAPQPALSRPANDSNASRMWFSDKIVAHKDRVESNVQKLYAALPLVCRESGLRFKEQSKLNAHLDFLFQYNRAQKERGKGGTSRSWYPDEALWVSDFASSGAPRESTSSSFFDRKDTADDDAKESYEDARVPVDESITKCRICGEQFTKVWDEEEEEWMYTNAVIGNILADGATQQTIFHKYCYDTVMTNSKHITPEHLIPGTPQGVTTKRTLDTGALKRPFEDEGSDDDDDDDDDVKKVKTE